MAGWGEVLDDVEGGGGSGVEVQGCPGVLVGEVVEDGESEGVGGVDGRRGGGGGGEEDGERGWEGEGFGGC